MQSYANRGEAVHTDALGVRAAGKFGLRLGGRRAHGRWKAPARLSLAALKASSVSGTHRRRRKAHEKGSLPCSGSASVKMRHGAARIVRIVRTWADSAGGEESDIDAGCLRHYLSRSYEITSQRSGARLHLSNTNGCREGIFRQLSSLTKVIPRMPSCTFGVASNSYTTWQRSKEVNVWHNKPQKCQSFMPGLRSRQFRSSVSEIMHRSSTS